MMKYDIMRRYNEYRRYNEDIMSGLNSNDRQMNLAVFPAFKI